MAFDSNFKTKTGIFKIRKYLGRASVENPDLEIYAPLSKINLFIFCFYIFLFKNEIFVGTFFSKKEFKSEILNPLNFVKKKLFRESFFSKTLLTK